VGLCDAYCLFVFVCEQDTRKVVDGFSNNSNSNNQIFIAPYASYRGADGMTGRLDGRFTVDMIWARINLVDYLSSRTHRDGPQGTASNGVSIHKREQKIFGLWGPP